MLDNYGYARTCSIFACVEIFFLIGSGFLFFADGIKAWLQRKRQPLKEIVSNPKKEEEHVSIDEQITPLKIRMDTAGLESMPENFYKKKGIISQEGINYNENVSNVRTDTSAADYRTSSLYVPPKYKIDQNSFQKSIVEEDNKKD